MVVLLELDIWNLQKKIWQVYCRLSILVVLRSIIAGLVAAVFRINRQGD